MLKLNVRICDQLHTDWMAYCEEIGKTSSEMVRGFIARNIMEKPHPSEPRMLRDSQRKTQVNVYLTESEIQNITWRSELNGGTRSKWIINAVRSALAQQPALTDKELDVLKDSNAAMNAIGKNLNQIARSLHKNEMPDRAVRIEQLAKDIVEHTDTVKSQIAIARSRWKIST